METANYRRRKFSSLRDCYARLLPSLRIKKQQIFARLFRQLHRVQLAFFPTDNQYSLRRFFRFWPACGLDPESPAEFFITSWHWPNLENVFPISMKVTHFYGKRDCRRRYAKFKGIAELLPKTCQDSLLLGSYVFRMVSERGE